MYHRYANNWLNWEYLVSIYYNETCVIKDLGSYRADAAQTYSSSFHRIEIQILTNAFSLQVLFVVISETLVSIQLYKQGCYFHDTPDGNDLLQDTTFTYDRQ